MLQHDHLHMELVRAVKCSRSTAGSVSQRHTIEDSGVLHSVTGLYFTYDTH